MKNGAFRKLWFRLLLLVMVAIGLEVATAQSVGVVEEMSNYRTIRHLAGETQVPVNPERVVALYPENVDAVLSLGVQPVGATLDAGNRFAPYLQKRLEGKTAPVGSSDEPNFEAILTLEPDLIIGHSWHADLYETLSRIVPTVLLPGNIEGNVDYVQHFLDTATVLNRSGEAQRILTAHQETVAQLSEKIKAVVGADAAIVFLEIKPDRQIRLYLPPSPQGDLMYEQLGSGSLSVNQHKLERFATAFLEER